MFNGNFFLKNDTAFNIVAQKNHKISNHTLEIRLWFICSPSKGNLHRLHFCHCRILSSKAVEIKSTNFLNDMNIYISPRYSQINVL